MSGDVPPGPARAETLPRWLIFAMILGFYLTLRGYHSFDGDQAYRLPLAACTGKTLGSIADDPFVQAFEAFNPHRGSLTVLDVVTRPLGLSAGLFVIFVLTFGATCLGVDRLARAVWPMRGPNVGLVAVGLVLAAKAGNIGTNHLFEAMVLDRLIAFALGWLAIASVVADPVTGRTRLAGRHRRWRRGSSLGRLAARDRAWSELDGLVSAGPVGWKSDIRTAILGVAGSGSGGAAGAGFQPGTGLVAARGYAGPGFLALDRRAAEPAAHAAAPLEDAAVAGLGLLPGPGRAGAGRRLAACARNRRGCHGRPGRRRPRGPASVDRAPGDHPAVAGSAWYAHRGAASSAGDGLSAVSHGDGRARNRPGAGRGTVGRLSGRVGGWLGRCVRS